MVNTARTADGRVRVLARSDVERLLDLPSCIAAVEHAFRLAAAGRVQSGVLGLHATDGGFHAKAAILLDDDPAGAPGGSWFAAKVNANFPANPHRHGLPTIQGVLALFDGRRGTVLALMDSIALTVARTAAATGVAARYFAKPDASSLTIIGCGAQATAQVSAVAAVRTIRRVTAVDSDLGAAERFADKIARELAVETRVAPDPACGAGDADVVITCTPSNRPFLGREHVKPGAFVAAVGADGEHKSEIEPELMRQAAVVVDSLAQCSTIGDLHHAIAARAMTAADVRAELGAAIGAPTRVRRRDSEVVVFDSTGVALEDVAAAALVFERAISLGVGSEIRL